MTIPMVEVTAPHSDSTDSDRPVSANSGPQRLASGSDRPFHAIPSRAAHRPLCVHERSFFADTPLYSFEFANRLAFLRLMRREQPAMSEDRMAARRRSSTRRPFGASDMAFFHATRAYWRDQPGNTQVAHICAIHSALLRPPQWVMLPISVFQASI
jgi:hypothetical protein